MEKKSPSQKFPPLNNHHTVKKNLKKKGESINCSLNASGSRTNRQFASKNETAAVDAFCETLHERIDLNGRLRFYQELLLTFLVNHTTNHKIMTQKSERCDLRVKSYLNNTLKLFNQT